MKFEDVQLSILQVYALTETASHDERDERREIEKFYMTINKAIKSAYNLMEDLNAKIGHPKQEAYLILKANGYGIRYTRRQIFIDFAIENKLKYLT